MASNLVRKVIIYPLLILFSMLFLALGLAFYFWVNIGYYQKPVKNFMAKQVGIYLDFSKIDGAFNSSLEPTLNIHDISLTKPGSKTPFLHLNSLSLTVSYTSLQKFKPIFSRIILDGASLDIEYDKNANLLINHQVITNLNDSKPSSIDIEALLLLQKQVSLFNFNLSLTDSKHKLNPVILKEININLTNNMQKKHSLNYISTFAKQSSLNLFLNWEGEKFSQVNKWKYGDLQIRITTKQKSNHQINIQANVINGQLESMSTVFNTSSKQVLGLNSNISGDTILSGSLNIVRSKASLYNIVANNLAVSTLSGPLLNNAKISGSYEVNKNGVINLSGINLAGLSSLKFNQLSNKLNLSGNINNISITWYGALTKPQDFHLTAEFKELALISIESNTPSLNNINGNVSVAESSGILNLNLNKSTFAYPKQLAKSIIISKLQNTTTWHTESSTESGTTTILQWKNTLFQTKDLDISTSGSYDTSKHLINSQTKIGRLNIPSIINYLPKKSAAATIDFIKTSMPKGYLSNTSLSVVGDVNRIPYKSGGGELTFNTRYNDVTLMFSPDWGAAEHLNGSVAIHNQAAKVTINSGSVGKYLISKSSFTVADLFLDNPLIVMNGYASGNSQDFIDYLTSTPLKSVVQSLPSQTAVTGVSEIIARATLPVSTPDKLRLSGSWIFKDNHFDFGSSLPQISNLNGQLNFSDKGVEQSNLTATALNSGLEFTLDNKQVVEVNAPQFDYSALKKFFMADTGDILSGRAATKVIYDAKNSHLTMKTNLSGVTIKAPAPLGKKESEVKELEITMQATPSTNEINVDYADTLFSRISLSSSMQLLNAKVAIGTDNYTINDSIAAPITLNVHVNETYIGDWIDFVKKIMPAKSASKLAKSKGVTTASNDFYPIKVSWNSSAIWFKNYNMDGGAINAIIDKNKASVFIDMPDIYGQVDYLTDKNTMNINLNKLILSSSNLVDLDNKLYHPVGFTPPVKDNEVEKSIPDIKLQVQNLYVQNHYLGMLNSKILQRNNNLYIESTTLVNKSSSTLFRLINHNIIPTTESKEYTELRMQTNISNYGILVSKLNIGDNLRRGTGLFDLALAWRGGIADFDKKKTIGAASLNVKNGVFTKVNPGLLGSLLGVVTLTSITNVTSVTNRLNLNAFFGKGFAFDTLDTQVDIKNNKLKIESLKMVSTSATIKSFGTIDLDNNSIDSYLTVEPRLGATVATTAGIVTLNPFIGVFVYAGQAVIGNPINKALAINYHISGAVESPTMSKTDISDQIQRNFSSTTNILQHPGSALDLQINK